MSTLTTISTPPESNSIPTPAPIVTMSGVRHNVTRARVGGFQLDVAELALHPSVLRLEKILPDLDIQFGALWCNCTAFRAVTKSGSGFPIRIQPRYCTLLGTLVNVVRDTADVSFRLGKSFDAKCHYGSRRSFRSSFSTRLASRPVSPAFISSTEAWTAATFSASSLGLRFSMRHSS